MLVRLANWLRWRRLANASSGRRRLGPPTPPARSRRAEVLQQAYQAADQAGDQPGPGRRRHPALGKEALPGASPRTARTEARDNRAPNRGERHKPGHHAGGGAGRKRIEPGSARKRGDQLHGRGVPEKSKQSLTGVEEKKPQFARLTDPGDQRICPVPAIGEHDKSALPQPLVRQVAPARHLKHDRTAFSGPQCVSIVSFRLDRVRTRPPAPVQPAITEKICTTLREQARSNLTRARL